MSDLGPLALGRFLHSQNILASCSAYCITPPSIHPNPISQQKFGPTDRANSKAVHVRTVVGAILSKEVAKK
jgi:hypothetical protein